MAKKTLSPQTFLWQFTMNCQISVQMVKYQVYDRTDTLHKTNVIWDIYEEVDISSFTEGYNFVLGDFHFSTEYRIYVYGHWDISLPLRPNKKQCSSLERSST